MIVQAFRASGLNLVVSAIVHWNTVYLSGSTAHLRLQGRNIPNELLKHISPLSWEHINLTGIYSWDTEQQMPEGFRSFSTERHDVHRPFGRNVSGGADLVPSANRFELMTLNRSTLQAIAVV